jgi:hypothetical protein
MTATEMSAKEEVRALLDALPDDVTFDDIMEAIYVRQKLEQAEQEIVEGKGIPQEQMLEIVRQWFE